jgi:hypothetical protein
VLKLGHKSSGSALGFALVGASQECRGGNPKPTPKHPRTSENALEIAGPVLTPVLKIAIAGHFLAPEHVKSPDL